MICCQNCGVELEENANYCSLCGEPVLDKNSAQLDHLTFGETKNKALTDFQKLNQLQKRKIFWEIAGIILFSGMLITLTINLVINHSMTWSKYIITTGFILFVNITLVLFLNKKIFSLFFLSFIASTVFLLLLDNYTGNNGWDTKLGIPLLLAAYIIVLSFILIERKAKQKELNLIAYSIIALGLLCVCIDGIISIYIESRLSLGWSIIVMVAVAFVSIILLYAHRRLKKGTDLKRFFHL
ncbi:MAG: DUF6320 domain-containing protein [Paludibacter sp.]|nr:DUF6320 domain-containing protein [Paludibacter sp.]